MSSAAGPAEGVGQSPACTIGNRAETDPAELERHLALAAAYGGRWWDDQRSALVVAFVGDPTAELDPLADRVAGVVCVLRVAHSVEELRRAARELTALTPGWVAAGYVVGGVGIDVPKNRVAVAIGAVDPALRRELDGRFASLVQASSFLELTRGSVADLSADVGDPDSAAVGGGVLSAALAYHCRLAPTGSAAS